MTKSLQRFLNYLRSDKFYRLVLVVFIIEAAWIAISAAYPQAFDENYHFGLIKVYSHYWLPFFTHQPPNADAFGAVARDPSYLYHYLMSFPYRLIELFTKRQMVQIVILRFINVGLFVWGITLFRRVLLKAGTSKALTNLSLMLFILIPIVPQLAAQINYDNLMIPLTALMILITFKLTDQIRAHAVSIFDFSYFIGIGLLTSLVKYAFLPIYAAMALFLVVVVFRANRKHSVRKFFNQLKESWKSISRPLIKAALIILMVVPLAMFVQRDIGNLIEYHSIEPNCSKVLSVKQCMAYSPWAANYKRHTKLVSSGNAVSLSTIFVYPFQWLYWMWFRLFFAVNGPNGNFTNYPPLPLPSAATLILLIGGVIAVLKWWRKLFRNNLKLLLLLFISGAYIVALIGQGYYTYTYTKVLENMNGRYLVPILLLLAAIFGQALSHMLAKANTRKALFAAIILLFFLEGGGVITFIARSNASWDVENKTVVKVNDAARKLVKKVIITGRKKYDSNLWFFN